MKVWPQFKSAVIYKVILIQLNIHPVQAAYYPLQNQNKSAMW